MTTEEALRSAIFALQYMTTTEDAERVLTIAANRGVGADYIDRLRTEWADLQTRSVHVIGGAA